MDSFLSFLHLLLHFRQSLLYLLLQRAFLLFLAALLWQTISPFLFQTSFSALDIGFEHAVSDSLLTFLKDRIKKIWKYDLEYTYYLYS
jgi:hypothetical protein